jgi:hypothetical protein
MAIFPSLGKFRTLCGLKAVGASKHPDKAECYFSPQILVLSTRSEALLDHIAATCRGCCLYSMVVSATSSMPWLPHQRPSLPPSNAAAAIKRPRPLLPSKNIFVVHHPRLMPAARHQPPTAAAAIERNLYCRCRATSLQYSSNPSIEHRRLMSCPRPFPTPSNSIAHCNRADAQCRPFRRCHLNLIVASAYPRCLVIVLCRRRNPLPPPLNDVKSCPCHQTPTPPPPLNAISIISRRHCHCCCRHCRWCWATTAATTTTIVKLNAVLCQRKRQQKQHQQLTYNSTNVKTFISPDDLDLLNLSTVFEVCNVGQGNFAIRKLLA